MTGLTAQQLREWAASTDDVDACPLDRESPETVRALTAALAVPAGIPLVERLEELAKSLWSDVLRPGGVTGGPDALACGAFFTRLGFLFKYKPYGVKIASPFGYSLFDLHPEQGFSFQLHVEPKLEAFHILRVKAGALLYISTRQEWAAAGEAWAKSLAAETAGEDSPFVWRPEPGDTTTVEQTEIVHTVLACVLEEYASCSVDAVERLFDQNSRSALTLPQRHLDLAALLRSCRAGLPARHLRRVPGGWATEPAGDPAILSVGDELWGGRVPVSPAAPTPLSPSDELVSVVVATDGDVRVHADGQAWPVPLGGLACVPPGLEASVTAEAGEGTVAVHRVSRALVQQDWTR
jgi:hypothetical protein